MDYMNCTNSTIFEIVSLKKLCAGISLLSKWARKMNPTIQCNAIIECYTTILFGINVRYKVRN